MKAGKGRIARGGRGGLLSHGLPDFLGQLSPHHCILPLHQRCVSLHVCLILSHRTVHIYLIEHLLPWWVPRSVHCRLQNPHTPLLQHQGRSPIHRGRHILEQRPPAGCTGWERVRAISGAAWANIRARVLPYSCWPLPAQSQTRQPDTSTARLSLDSGPACPVLPAPLKRCLPRLSIVAVQPTSWELSAGSLRHRVFRPDHIQSITLCHRAYTTSPAYQSGQSTPFPPT